MTPCYTAQFVAPEVLRRQGYDQACDVWSLGVLLYTMQSGHAPFATIAGDTPQQILHRISHGDFPLSGGNWDSVSDQAKDLVKQMMHVNPQRRLTAKLVMRHSWVANRLNLVADSRINYLNVDPHAVKHAVHATYRAINSSLHPGPLHPVNSSALAQRRGVAQPKSSTEV